MFTGLIEERGRIAAVEARGDDRRLWIEARVVLEGAKRGDSIAVSGVCLTIVELATDRFAVEAVPETLRRTTLGERVQGDAVNLERALRADQRLDGHLVQGHVDGVAMVSAVSPEGEGARVRFEVPAELRRYVAEKGSITLDGVSLTVAALLPDGCEIAYIPHTLAVTTAGRHRPGQRVNMEVDLLARYLERLLVEAGRLGRSS